MYFSPQHVAVVGAAGPVGVHLVRELVARGRRVTAVSRERSRGRLEELLGGEGVELRSLPFLEAEALAEVVRGCHLVADCIDLSRDEMERYPRTSWEVGEAARRSGARCLHVSAYGALVSSVEETSATRPGEDLRLWEDYRSQVTPMMLAFGAAIVHLPVVFGPHDPAGVVQDALRRAVAGQPIRWLTPSDTPLMAAYLPDAVRVTADLAHREGAYGGDWAVPGTGVLIAQRLRRIASRHLGRPVRLGGSPSWLWLLASLQLGHFFARRQLDQYLHAFSYDSSKVEAFLGEPTPTPYEVAIPRTLDWILAQGEGVVPVNALRP